MLNTSRLGVLVDAEEEFENLLAHQRRENGSVPPTAAGAWANWPERSHRLGLAEAAPLPDWKYRSGRANSVVRRALDGGRPTATDRSLLELLLHLAAPRLALDGTATELLVRFGTLRRVLAASEREITTVRLMSPPVAGWLQGVGRAAREPELAGAEHRRRLASPRDLRDHLEPLIGRQTPAHSRLLLLDRICRLRQEVVIAAEGTGLDEPRPTDILRACLTAGADAAIVVRHSPDRAPVASALELARSRQLARALATADITLQDHVLGDGQRLVSLCGQARQSASGAFQIPAPRLSAA